MLGRRSNGRVEEIVIERPPQDVHQSEHVPHIEVRRELKRPPREQSEAPH
jgi:hypothetical protein